MTTNTASRTAAPRVLLNKVPEVTVWFWLIKILCTTVGESFADWINMQLGVGLIATAIIFTVVFAAVLGWRLGANPVLAFWLAYILTRPLGANLGDWLASPKVPDRGLGLGTLVTSLIFLSAILATVVYLTLTRTDVIEGHQHRERAATYHQPRREWPLVGVMTAAAVAVGILLNWASAQPHANAAAESEG